MHYFVISQAYSLVWKTNQSIAIESLGNGNNTIFVKGKGLWKLAQMDNQGVFQDMVLPNESYVLFL